MFQLNYRLQELLPDPVETDLNVLRLVTITIVVNYRISLHVITT